MTSLKQFVFERMNNQGYIPDGELAKFCGGEPNFCTASGYSREYTKLKEAKRYFAELEKSPTVIISKGHRKYLIRDSKWDNLYWNAIPKIYFQYLKKKGVKIV